LLALAHGQIELNAFSPVFAGLDPVIHAALSICGNCMDARVKPAHDEERMFQSGRSSL
jgi:hypothetical protein